MTQIYGALLSGATRLPFGTLLDKATITLMDATARLAPVHRAAACDPFDDCPNHTCGWCYDPPMFPSDICGCCPSGCACC